MPRTTRLCLSLALATATAACTHSEIAVQPEFGMAFHSLMAAQIAYPDAPPPTGPVVADGARVGLAQTRYRAGEVIPPRAADTTLVSRDVAPMPR